VIDRLGPSLYAAAGPAGQALARYRLPDSQAARLANHRPPAWVYLHGLKSPLSSTALRAARGAKRPPQVGVLKSGSSSQAADERAQ